MSSKHFAARRIAWHMTLTFDKQSLPTFTNSNTSENKNRKFYAWYHFLSRSAMQECGLGIGGAVCPTVCLFVTLTWYHVKKNADRILRFYRRAAQGL